MKMKKFACLILSVCLALSCTIFVTADTNAEDVISLLSELSIMTGDPDGNLRLEDLVTRSEFTKVAVASSQYKDSVATNLAVSPFKDVTYQHWSAPYVKVAVNNGIAEGYPDASFRPDSYVTYEEAVTIMLRVLGYTNSDFGASWPSGQLGLANNLNMTDGIDRVQGETMTRADVARLAYNTLNTKQKNSQSKLLTIFNANLIEDITIISSAVQDKTLQSNEVYTSNGVMKLDFELNPKYLGAVGDAVVKDGNKMISFLPTGETTGLTKYVVYSTTSNGVVAYVDGKLMQLNISDNTEAYNGKMQTTYGALKNNFELGDIIFANFKDGKVDYVCYSEGNLVGPITAYAGNWQSMVNLSSSTSIVRDGIEVMSSDIQNYDIVYYSENLDMVMVYSTKVTGIYEKASPNKDTPTEITISGETYGIEDFNAFEKLSSTGSFAYGDTITVLLGKDGEIADVIDTSVTSADSVVGYLLSCGEKEYTSSTEGKYTSNYVDIVLTSGEKRQYPVNKKYSDYVNSVVKLTFKNGVASLTALKSSGTYTGKFDWSGKTLGGADISSSVEILDVGELDKNKTSLYTKVYPQRIDSVSLTSSDILYAETDSLGRISKMILDDVTGDCYSYGIMLSAQTTSSAALSGTYTYIVDGMTKTASTSGSLFSIKSNTPAKFAFSENGMLEMAFPLSAVSGKISEVTNSYVAVGNVKYSLSDKVAVYRKTDLYSSGATLIPVNDIMNNDSYSLTAYYDKMPLNGGRVRVIIAVPK